MSMAARAISSRAVSSISLAGIGGMLEELHPLNLLSPRLAAAAAPQLDLLSPRLAAAAAPQLELRTLFRGEGEGSTLALALVATEFVLDGVDEGLPGSLDDVVGHTHRAPRLVAVAGGDEHARPRRGALALVEDAHLVVEQAHLAKARKEVLESLA